LALSVDHASQRVQDESQQTPPAAVSVSEDPIINFGLDGLITSWNGAAEMMLGYSSAEAIGQSVRLYTPPESADYAELRLKRQLREAQQNRISERLEVQVAHKSGARRDAWLFTSSIHDSGADLTGLSVILRDIPETKRVESEHAMLATIVNASDDPILS